MNRLTIISAYYKNIDMTKDFVDCIAKHKRPNYKFVLVNAGNKEKIEHPCIDVMVDLEQNQSFSNSMNTGLRYVDSEYICILGNDTFPQTTGFFDLLIQKQQEIQSMIVCPENDNPTSEAYRHLKSHTDSDGNVYYKMFPAICWLMPASVLQEVGYFDERFKVGTYEDNDYCDRVRECGGTIVLDKRAMVHHKLSQTMKLFDTTAIMQENYKIYKDKWK